MSNAIKYHIAVSLLEGLLARQLLTEHEYADARATLAEQYNAFF